MTTIQSVQHFLLETPTITLHDESGHGAHGAAVNLAQGDMFYALPACNLSEGGVIGLHSEAFMSVFDGSEGTAALWVKPQAGAVDQALLSFVTDTGDTLAVGIGATGRLVLNGITLPQDLTPDWTHLALVWSVTAGTLAIYVNGSPVEDGAYFPREFSGLSGCLLPSRCVIGAYALDNPAMRFTGSVREWVLYDAALTEDEIYDLAHNPSKPDFGLVNRDPAITMSEAQRAALLDTIRIRVMTPPTVFDFGADPLDADNTGPFQRAVESGAAVFVPPGNWRVRHLDVNNPTRLYGTFGTRILHTSGSGESLMSLRADKVFLEWLDILPIAGNPATCVETVGDRRDFHMRNVAIRGWDSELTAGSPFRYTRAALLFGNIWHTSIRDCNIAQTGGNAVEYTGCGSANLVDNSHFQHTNGHIVYQSPTASNVDGGLSLNYNGVTTQGGALGQIRMSYLGSSAFRSCHIEAADAGTGAAAIPVVLEGTPADGVLFDSCIVGAKFSHYAFAFTGEWEHRNITILNTSLGGRPGFIRAGVQARRVNGLTVIGCRGTSGDEITPFVEWRGDGYSARNLRIHERDGRHITT